MDKSQVMNSVKNGAVQSMHSAGRATPWFGLCAVAYLFLHLGGIAGFAEASLWWFLVIALLPFECVVAVLLALAAAVGLFFLGLFLVFSAIEISRAVRRWRNRRTLHRASSIIRARTLS